MSDAGLRERLRSVLLFDWDPLLIGGNPNLADEYDKYLPRLISLVEAGTDMATLVEALKSIEIDELGMLSPSSGIEAAAAQILRLR